MAERCFVFVAEFGQNHCSTMALMENDTAPCVNTISESPFPPSVI